MSKYHYELDSGLYTQILKGLDYCVSKCCKHRDSLPSRRLARGKETKHVALSDEEAAALILSGKIFPID